MREEFQGVRLLWQHSGCSHFLPVSLLCTVTCPVAFSKKNVSWIHLCLCSLKYPNTIFLLLFINPHCKFKSLSLPGISLLQPNKVSAFFLIFQPFGSLHLLINDHNCSFSSLSDSPLPFSSLAGNSLSWHLLLASSLVYELLMLACDFLIALYLNTKVLCAFDSPHFCNNK